MSTKQGEPSDVPQDYPCEMCGAAKGSPCVYMPASQSTIKAHSKDILARMALTGTPTKKSHNARYNAMSDARDIAAARRASEAREKNRRSSRIAREKRISARTAPGYIHPIEVQCGQCGADPGYSCIYISPTDRDGGKSGVNQIGSPTEKPHNGRYVAAREAMNYGLLKRQKDILKEFFQRFGGIFEEGPTDGLEA